MAALETRLTNHIYAVAVGLARSRTAKILLMVANERHTLVFLLSAMHQKLGSRCGLRHRR